MDDYIYDLLINVGHTKPIKVQLFLYKHIPIVYGASKQFTDYTNTSAPLNEKGILCVQNIVSALLYYGCAVDNKLMVDLSAIVSHQAAATVDTAAAVYQLLDYITMYPHDGITYRASDMNFSAHSALYTSMNACHAAAWDIKIFSH